LLLFIICSHIISVLFCYQTLLCASLYTLFPYTTLFRSVAVTRRGRSRHSHDHVSELTWGEHLGRPCGFQDGIDQGGPHRTDRCRDRKSTRLNSSHVSISYAVFCLKKKKYKKKKKYITRE